METTLASSIVYCTMAVGGLIWLVALWSLRRLLATEPYVTEQSTIPQPKQSVQRAVLQAALRGQTPSVEAGAHFLEETGDSLTFQLAGGTLVCFSFQEDYHGTHVEGAVDLARTKQTYGRVMAGLVLIVMPVVILATGWVLIRFVAQSPNAVVRWQAFQILQIAHVLWPPFLVSKLFQTRLTYAPGFTRSAIATARFAQDVPAM